MQIGMCLDWRVNAMWEAACAAGADYVELNFSSFEQEKPAAVAALAAHLQARGLACRAYNCMFPGARYPLTGPHKDHAAAGEFLAAQLEKLAPLGARIVVFGSSGARGRVDGQSSEAAREEVVTFLRETAAPLLAHYGWICAVEPLSECNLIRTTADGRAIVEAVGHPSVRLLADVYHMGQVGERPEDLLACAGALAHVHVAAQAGRRLPAATDPDDYVAVFRALRRIGYTGQVSIEGILRDPAAPGAEMTAAVACLRSAWEASAN